MENIERGSGRPERLGQTLSKYVNLHSSASGTVTPLSALPASLILVSRSFLFSLRDPDLTPAGVTIPGLELVTSLSSHRGLGTGVGQNQGQSQAPWGNQLSVSFPLNLRPLHKSFGNKFHKNTLRCGYSLKVSWLSEPSTLWYSLRPCLVWGAWLEARLVASLEQQTAEHRAATGESQSVRDPRDGNTSLRRPETENTDNYGATLRVTWSDIEWHHHGLGPHQRWDPLQAELHHQVDLGDSGGHHLQGHPRGGPQGREPPRLWRGCCPPSLCPCGDLEVSKPREI